MTGDGRSRDADADTDESWTEMEGVRPELVEAVPIRHGMVLGGRYAVETIIGRGGSGVVVRAHDRDLQQVVAIKIVRAELAGQRMWAARLAREVRLARQIHHPHVCRVFDFQQAEGRAFLVMELAEGGTLREEIRSGALAARPLAERIADARAVASALAAIHAAGIVHRDLTPQNLLRMGDGRVVVSDFGLATDASESTSVHGGTVAYMAPEVLRGGNSSFASDIWALGVVMHEMVFGTKPRWSEAAAPEMLVPAHGRQMTAEERAVFEACRACTAKEPARRIARAEEAGRLLTARRRWWARRLFASRRPFVWATALTFAAAVAAGALRARRATQTRGLSADDSPLIIPTGEAADWTDVSTVIAEVPDRIACTRLLPDQRTIRFVWGSPPRAEDIDTVTRKRVPSPLVPVAYAEGCPDVSPDGKGLLFQGHAPDGRAFAFLSKRPDGRDATPVVQTAEPSTSSEPTWLADNDAFSFDVDARHTGVFSVKLAHTTVLPEPTQRPFVTFFRSFTGGLIFVSAFSERETELVGRPWPQLGEKVRIRAPGGVLDLRVENELVYYTLSGVGIERQLVELNPTTRRARWLGRIRGQSLRNPTFLRSGLTFSSIRESADLFRTSPAGGTHRVTNSGDLLAAGHCGPDLIVTRWDGDHTRIERIDRTGTSVRAPVPSRSPYSPGCSPSGDVVYYVDEASRATICDDKGCRRVTERPTMALAVSPDGRRLAMMSFEPRGIVVWWIATTGGETHDVAETETGCNPGWASKETIWVSRRRDGKIIWTEVDADTGRETGTVRPGQRDCSNGRPDPASPVDPDLRVFFDQTSQLRLLDRQYLSRN